MSCHSLSRYSATLASFAAAVLLASCGSSSTSSAGPGGGSGAGSTHAYASGVGGAGQTGAAKFLIATQVGFTPIATVVNSSGTLAGSQVALTSQPTPTSTTMTAAIDPTGTFYYQVGEPGLWAFTINRQNGNLTELAASPYQGSVSFDAIAVDQLGKFLYSYGINGAVYAFSIQAGTGQLTEIAGSPFAAATSGSMFSDPSDRIAISQDDRYLYLATGSGIFAYSINASTGALTTVSGSPFGASAGAGLALVAPSSGFLYETIGGVSTPPGIYGYSIDSSTGALTPISGSPFGGSCSAANPTSPANGKFLFGVGCGMYQINASTGALTFLATDPEAANNDSWAAFDPNSAFVWIVTTQTPCFQCQVGADAYQVDAKTGNMTLVPNSFFLMTNSEFGSIGGLAITQ